MSEVEQDIINRVRGKLDLMLKLFANNAVEINDYLIALERRLAGLLGENIALKEELSKLKSEAENED